MSRLNLELYGTKLGTLTKKDLPGTENFSFEVLPSVYQDYPLSSTIMSLAVPLNMQFSAQQKKRFNNFFSELLPEGRNLNWLLWALPPNEQNTYGLLRKYGKDSAGALTIYDPDDPTSSKQPKLEELTKEQVCYLLEHMPEAPLANSPVSGKVSLGGVQGKILLVKKGSRWCRAHFGYPSTHILKPVTTDYPTIIYDEAFCMHLAYKVGLTTHPVWIESFDGTDALVIERFDRDQSIVGGRIHQEDFNQALGLRGNQKYQESGGRVTAKRIAQTLQRFGSDEDVRGFASQLVFAAAIGNLDMHAKNISIFHYPDESIALSPTYDQVPLRHQNTDGRLALALGGEYVHANLTKANIRTELLSWKSPAFPNEAITSTFIEELLETCQSALSDLSPVEGAYPLLREEISTFITNLLSNRPTGKHP